MIVGRGRPLVRSERVDEARTQLAAAEAVRCPEIGKMIGDAVMGTVPQVAQPVIAAMEAGLLRHGDPNLALEQFLEMCLGWMLRGLIWRFALRRRGPRSIAQLPLAATTMGAFKKFIGFEEVEALQARFMVAPER